MSLQQIIDTAVNVEVNRSKLVAQTVSRSGRISVASRNWANPFRFVVTPKPVWTAAEYREVFEPLFDNDRYLPHSMLLNNIDNSTFLADLGNSWMIPYQGGGDVSSNNNNLDGYFASSNSAGTRIILNYTATNAPVAGTYIVKQGDYIRPTLTRHPYIATDDVIVPTVFTGKTGTIAAVGTRIFPNRVAQPNSNVSYIATATRTAITGIASTTGLSVGQIITENGTNTGSFGGITYIASVDSTTQISIISTTDCTSGAITFDGSARTDSPSMAIPIHRGFIGTIAGTEGLYLGARAANFNVIVTKLPQIRYLPGQLVELTSDLELIEEIL
jgi:hypothetical protein